MSEALTVSPKEAARRLGIGLTSTYRLLRQGRLRAVRVGTRPNFRVPLRAIEEALAEPERLSIGSAKESRSE
jgi:excisionase family DNA binding protein